MNRQALGRGLDALISEEYREAPDLVTELDIDEVAPSDRQPRTRFDEQALDELARSIEANGLLQPILVRRAGRRLEIVAGERRWRAAKRLGHKKIPAMLRDMPPQKSLEAALVENLQRENLNPMEEGRAYDWLIQDYGLSQEEVAQRVGKDRTTVTNMLRLLRLPDEVQNLIEEGQLSMGHARALLALGGPDRMRSVAQRVVDEGLSVRRVEALVRNDGPATAPAKRPEPPKDIHDKAAERQLERRLGTKVTIKRSRRGGRIEVSFFSEQELQRLYELLLPEA